jgi:hypothetical protein
MEKDFKIEGMHDIRQYHIGMLLLKLLYTKAPAKLRFHIYLYDS